MCKRKKRSGKINKLFVAVVSLVTIAILASNAWALKSYSSFHPAKREAYAKPTSIPQIGIPSRPIVILDSPGRVVGSTYYDMQSNGSTGHRIVVDSLGQVHFCWIGSSNPSLNPRNINYGFIGSNDSLHSATLAGPGQDGYPQIDLYNGIADHPMQDRAIIGYHDPATPEDRFAVESGIGSGSFAIDSLSFPIGLDQPIWPQFSVDINDNIQSVATQSNIPVGDPMNHIYTRKMFGQSDWTSPVVFDQSYCPSPVVTSSPVSTKSAIVWTHPIQQDNNQYDNDVVFVQSPDGINWDFAGGMVNVTNYPYSAQNDTTLRAYTDVDAVYDHNDNLHIIWNAAYVTRDSANAMVVLYHAALFHWSAQTGIDVVYEHPTRTWPCDMGAWNLAISKMSIGVDDSNHLFAVFTRFDPSDYARYDTINGDPSPCGGDNAMPCANGEIYMTYSVDRGESWSAPSNLTNTATPNCLAGNCDNDNWSSLAEKVDEFLHIIYIDDKDAGGAPLSEGDFTLNPVIYLKVPNPVWAGSGCSYTPGDVNGRGGFTGLDVVYGVSYLKGGPPPIYSCECPPGSGNVWYVVGDVNGSCTFTGLDITFMVAYLKGQQNSLVPCPSCPPMAP